MRFRCRRIAAVLLCAVLLTACGNNTAGNEITEAPSSSDAAETLSPTPQTEAAAETQTEAPAVSGSAAEPPPETSAAPPETTGTSLTAAPASTTQAAQPADPPVAAELVLNGGGTLLLSSLRHYDPSEDAPAVYFTREISADSLLSIYRALPSALSGRVAVKLSTGESSASNYLRPELIGGLVQSLNGSIAECMTAYGGVRAVAALHKQVAKDRGYTAIAPFDLMDEDGDHEIPHAGTRIDRAIVGSHLPDYDGILVLSHFKGHPLAGFGGAIKNVGIGLSSRKGKIYVHSADTRTSGIVLHDDQKAWLEALAETVKAVSDYENGGRNMLYISVMNRLSVDCDCVALPAEPDMHDVGVLASTDPVALDQACVDLVYAVPDGHSLIVRMETRSGEHVLAHAEAIGLGSRSYRLVCIDAP